MAGYLPQASSFPPISIWRVFRFLSIPLGAGETPEAMRVRVFARRGLFAALVWTAAAPVTFPAKTLEITAREIERERGWDHCVEP